MLNSVAATGEVPEFSAEPSWVDDVTGAGVLSPSDFSDVFVALAPGFDDVGLVDFSAVYGFKTGELVTDKVIGIVDAIFPVFAEVAFCPLPSVIGDVGH